MGEIGSLASNRPWVMRGTARYRRTPLYGARESVAQPGNSYTVPELV